MKRKKPKAIDLSSQKEMKTLNITELSQEAYATQDRLQVQEIVDEKKKTHEKMMNEIISSHMDYDPEGYYILVLSKNDYKNPNVIKTKYIVRATKPDPDWNQDLYYFDNKNATLYFIYSLPKMEDTVYFKNNHDRFTQSIIEPYMKMIDAMMDGSIRNWDAPVRMQGVQESVKAFDATAGLLEKFS